MKMATMCSGIGAPEVAAGRLGWPAGLWCSEIEKFPSAVLAARFPGTVNLGDMTAPDFGERALAVGRPDVLVAGTPCQAFSVAGKRGGLGDARGNLTLRFVELCDEIEPEWIVWENVPGVLSDKTNGFGCLLGGLAGSDAPLVLPGGGSWPRAGVVAGERRRLVWRVLDAQRFGVAQRRKRVFVVACRGAGRIEDPVEVLFERAGLCGDLAAGGEEGEVARDLSASGIGTCGADDNQAQAGHLIPIQEIGKRTGRSTNDRGCGIGVGRDGDPMFTLAASSTHGVAHALRGEGHDASEDGTGRGVPLVTSAVTSKWAKGSGGPSGDECQNLVTVNARQDPSVMEDRVGALDRFPNTHAMVERARVRRLMPLECERLQGFDDGCTDIPGASDSARYRAIGNSMAVPVLEWILAGIEKSGGGSGRSMGAEVS